MNPPDRHRPRVALNNAAFVWRQLGSRHNDSPASHSSLLPLARHFAAPRPPPKSPIARAEPGAHFLRFPSLAAFGRAGPRCAWPASQWAGIRDPSQERTKDPPFAGALIEAANL